MTLFTSETKAFQAAEDKVAELCRSGRPNAGLRVLQRDDGSYKVLIVPERQDGLPFYI